MIDSVLPALRKVALFQELPDAELIVLTRQVTRMSVARGQAIFEEGDPGDGLYIVADGHVGIGRQNPDGDELLLAVYEPGEYFGELALFDRGPRSAGARAIDDCTVLFLSRTAFHEFIEGHLAALLRCVETIIRQFRRLTDVTDEIALMDVRRRLARRLVRLVEQGMVGVGSEDPRQISALRLTQQQLANMTGATRESVNKHLHGFVDEGIIQLDRGGIRVKDPERLHAVSEGLM